MDINNISSQSLTSLGTITAIVLMPLWLSLYSITYSSTSDLDTPDLTPPYKALVRTLVILVFGMSVGIFIRWVNDYLLQDRTLHRIYFLIAVRPKNF